MTAEQAAEAAKELTFEKVWAALMETRQQIEKTNKQMQETDKRIEETNKQMQETDKRIEESHQRTENTLAYLSKNLGGLGNNLGRLTESILSAELWKKFSAMGYPVTRQSSQVKFSDGKKVLAEVDLFIENGECAILVEIKTDLAISHIDDHLKRIELVREYLDAKDDRRKLMGAVAGGIVPENVLNYAHKKGLFVAVQSGETVTIADTPHGFRPQEW